jgi:signal peptidase I
MEPKNDGDWGPIYVMAMTEEVLAKVKELPMVEQVAVEKILPEMHTPIYPLAYTYKWNRDNYGPLWIPAKGETIELTEDNILRYRQCIVNYERNTLDYSNGVAYLNGEPATEYTFKMDYYWMMGDNRHNSADSRMWGFVPEDHIVGRPMFVWLSLDRDVDWFKGKIRWNRFGLDASK